MTKRQSDHAARDMVAEQIAKLRAVAENPLIRLSVRVEARRALKALVPPKVRVIGQVMRAGGDWVHEEDEAKL